MVFKAVLKCQRINSPSSQENVDDRQRVRLSLYGVMDHIINFYNIFMHLQFKCISCHLLLQKFTAPLLGKSRSRGHFAFIDRIFTQERVLRQKVKVAGNNQFLKGFFQAGLYSG